MMQLPRRRRSFLTTTSPATEWLHLSALCLNVMIGNSLGLIFLELRLPNRPLTIAGVVLYDALHEEVVIRMRDHWEGIADPEDQEVLSEYEHGLRRLANELGARAFLDHINSNFANTVSASLEYRVNRPLGDLDRYAEQVVRQLQFDFQPGAA